MGGVTPGAAPRLGRRFATSGAARRCGRDVLRRRRFAAGGGCGGGRRAAMLLTVFCLRRDRSELTFSLQVDADFELQNFRALCELESGIPAAESQVGARFPRAALGGARRPPEARPASGGRRFCGEERVFRGLGSRE